MALERLRAIPKTLLVMRAARSAAARIFSSDLSRVAWSLTDEIDAMSAGGRLLLLEDGHCLKDHRRASDVLSHEGQGCPIIS